MNFKLTESMIVNGVLAAVTVGTAIYAWCTGKEVKKVCKNLNKSVDDFRNANDITVDIAPELINMTVENEVKEEVRREIPAVCRQAVKECKDTFKEEVKREINAQYSSIKDEVEREVKDQVGHIDINDVKKKVIQKATDEANEKFKGELQGVLDKFNKNLDDVGTIYTSIAKKFSEH